MLAVARRRLPTARPVALGEQRHAGLIRDNYFVTEAIPHARSLDEFLDDVLPQLDPPWRARVRHGLTVALARHCADLHRGGVAQNDMHPGNVLVEWNPDQSASTKAPRLRLYLIDLPGAHLSKPMSWSRSCASLAMLNSGLLGRSTRADRWRFWRTYLQSRDDLRVSPRKGAADVARRSLRHALAIVRGRDKRCLRENRDFRRLRSSAGLAYAVQEIPRDELAALLADPNRPIREFHHAPAKISHSSVVVRAQLAVGGRMRTVAYKRCRVKSWWKAMLLPWRRSRALRGWLLGNALAQRGIPTARPLLACVPARGRDSFLATQWIEGAENLHLFGWQIADRPPRERSRRAGQCAESLGELIGKLHAWRIAHRDLKGGNLAVVERDDCVESFLIDLDGMRVARRLPASTRADNLARLAASLELHPWVTPALRLRFLRAYVRTASPETSDWKQLWRQVQSSYEGLARRKRRAGRADG